MSEGIIVVLFAAALAAVAFHQAEAQRQEVLGHIYQCTYIADGRRQTTSICSIDQKNADMAAKIFLCAFPMIRIRACADSMVCRKTSRTCRYKGWGDPRNWWE